jgi:predicted nucleic acid-binding protein
VILVDTSVWIQHLRHGHDGLARLLHESRVVCHPFVIGEIALGALTRRREVLAALAELPVVPLLDQEDTLAFIEQRALGGRGVGWVDVHLLGSAVLDRTLLWTFDRRLDAVALELDVAWDGT